MLILSLRKALTGFGMGVRTLTYDVVEDFIERQRRKRRLLREKRKLDRIIREDRMERIINDAKMIKKFGKKSRQELENASLSDLARWSRYNKFV